MRVFVKFANFLKFFFIGALALCLTACASSTLSPEALAAEQTRNAELLGTYQAKQQIETNGQTDAWVPNSTPIPANSTVSLGGAEETPLPPLQTQRSATQQTTLTTEPNRTSTPTRTAAVTTPTKPVAVNTPTRTAVLPTQTAPLPAGWEGDWTVFLGQEGGPYTTGTLSVIVEGENLTGQAILAGVSYEFSGEINQYGQYVLGDYTQDTTAGWFYWTLLSDVQFGGTLDNNIGFCGTKGGTQPPDPCVYYLIS